MRFYSFDVITVNGFDRTCFCDCEIKIRNLKFFVVFFAPYSGKT